LPGRGLIAINPVYTFLITKRKKESIQTHLGAHSILALHVHFVFTNWFILHVLPSLLTKQGVQRERQLIWCWRLCSNMESLTCPVTQRGAVQVCDPVHIFSDQRYSSLICSQTHPLPSAAEEERRHFKPTTPSRRRALRLKKTSYAQRQKQYYSDPIYDKSLFPLATAVDYFLFRFLSACAVLPLPPQLSTELVPKRSHAKGRKRCVKDARNRPASPVSTVSWKRVKERASENFSRVVFVCVCVKTAKMNRTGRPWSS
jgi:hypothetical protein